MLKQHKLRYVISEHNREALSVGNGLRKARCSGRVTTREREGRAGASPEKCTQCTTREAAKRDHAVGGARKGGSKKI